MGDMRSEKVRSLFNESAYVKEKCALPATILNKLFGDEATIAEDGSFNGYSPGTKDVMLDTDGKPASFENWIARQVSSHLEGKTMLKGSPIAAPGGTGQTAPGGSANPWAKGAENYTEQNKLIASNPELAKLMAATAGAKLPF